MSMRGDLNRSRPTGRRQRWSGDGGRRPSAAANAACCATRGERTVAKGRRPEHCAILCGHGMQTLIDILLHIDVHLDAAIQRYGSFTIVLARFVPIVRTFAPFVAGVGRMTYRRFLIYNIGGAVLWVVLLVAGGYLFGNLPFIRRRFTLAIVGIIIVSVLPAVLEMMRHRRRAKVSR